MDTGKQAIIDALRAFVEQRPGFDWHNYSTASGYRSDQRRATRQLHDARQLLRAVELRDSITADDILRESIGGRINLSMTEAHGAPHCDVDYCVGQYWCTEFRAGVCRLLASVLWTWKRDHAMPEIGAAPCGSGKAQAGMYWDGHARRAVSGGDWLRNSFKREYGRPLASRWFS